MRMGCKYLIGWNCRLKEEKYLILSFMISDKRKLRALAPSGFRKSHTPYRALNGDDERRDGYPRENFPTALKVSVDLVHTKYLGKLKLPLVTSRLQSIELSLRALRIQEVMVFLEDRLRNRSWNSLVV